MKKKLKRIGIGVVALLVILLIGMTVCGGLMVKGAVNGAGPAVMGVPVTLEKAAFSPLRGTIGLTGLHVGNPDGFKTGGLLDLEDVRIELDLASLFRDPIVVKRVIVRSPHITYERGLLDSNFGALMKQLDGGGTDKESSSGAKAREKEGRKLVIDELVITDPALNVSITAAGGHFIPVKLGHVELKGIGREGGGITVVDAIKIILSLITSNIENAVKGAGDLLGSGGKALGSGARAVGGAVASGASSLVGGIGGLLGGAGDGGDRVSEPAQPASEVEPGGEAQPAEQ